VRRAGVWLLGLLWLPLGLVIAVTVGDHWASAYFISLFVVFAIVGAFVVGRDYGRRH
jgi:hypothetical protein